MFTRKRDTSFEAFAQTTSDTHEALKAWNEAAYKVVDNSHAKRMLAFVGTASYGLFLAQMCRFVNLSLIAYGDKTAVVSTVLASLPLLAGIGTVIHQSRVGARGMSASILPAENDSDEQFSGDIKAQHPKVFAKAVALKKTKPANQIGAAHYQM